MDLSDEELEAVQSLVYDEVYYGDDNVVYGPDGDYLRAALEKLDKAIEIRNRCKAK